MCLLTEQVFVGWRDNRMQVEQQGFRFERIDADERARDRLRGGGVRSLLAAPRLRRELAGSTEIEDTITMSLWMFRRRK